MRALILLFFLFSLTASGWGQTAADPKPRVQVVGTKVSLLPPADFADATQFPGFQNEELNASIVITEFPAPFAEIIKGFDSPEQLAKRQMTLLEKQQVQNAENDGWLYKIQQKQFGIEFLKWVYAFDAGEKSVLAVATFPVENAKEVSEKLKSSILSASYNKQKIVGLTDGLNFKITESVNLKIANRITNGLLLTLKGVSQSQNNDEPVFVVGQSLGNYLIEDHKAFAQNRIQKFSNISAMQVKSVVAVNIDNLDGYEVMGVGKDEKTGKPMFIYQTVLFDAQSYFILGGTVSEINQGKYLSEFREITISFKRINQ